MKIICATNMPLAEEAFGRLGTVEVLSPAEMTAERVREADILAVRSTVKINRELLEGSKVRFAGTATIGTDHMDIPWLEQAGIRWCSAAGCNANSVAEYIVAAILKLALKRRVSLNNKVLAVVGVGNVGKLVAVKVGALGLRVMLNDPPRFEVEKDPALLPLDEILSKADIVSLHVPLTKEQPYPTYHLADAQFFAKLKPGAVFINAARGAVVDSDALLAALDSGQVSDIVLDTWEGEPVYRPDVLRRVALATPHIAGHSYEGKVMGTVMVFRAVCNFLGIAPEWNYENLMLTPSVPEIVLNPLSKGTSEEMLLEGIVRQIYDIEQDDHRMRQTADLPDSERARAFERLRQNYPVRREFGRTILHASAVPQVLRQKLRGLGFRLAENLI